MIRMMEDIIKTREEKRKKFKNIPRSTNGQFCKK